MNSFGDADEADRRRAQVLMAGVDARVVKNTTGNGLPIYQVISRPMNNRQAVASAQQRLQNNGIDSIIVEQRR
ncbi:SPOR domain-containing protein [Psychrobacter sp. TB47]|uniref:SPOR domain-containing protein n=1 Tax=Psychrobacter sp. TB47 TaxID=985259 RepID=UPI00321695D5